MKRITMLLFASLTALLFSGCATTFEQGAQISTNQVSSIVKGVTTRPQIEAMFGTPDATFITPNGGRGVMYNHVESTGSGFGLFAKSTVKQKVLQIVFRSDGKVEDFDYNDSGAKTYSYSPFSGMKETRK
jgi:outer membrane protein assembly factor BamE (lipoprotein component of BamABCDE complex)